MFDVQTITLCILQSLILVIIWHVGAGCISIYVWMVGWIDDTQNTKPNRYNAMQYKIATVLCVQI